MSYAAERWARAQVAGNTRAKAVLLELAHCLNKDTGLCYPSAARIAKVTELKTDTVYAAIGHLVERGLIRKIAMSGTSSRYELIGFNPSDWPDEKDGEPTPKTRVPRKRGNPETGVPTYPETGVPAYPETGVPTYPETGVLTGNMNREYEQGMEQGIAAPTCASDPVPLNEVPFPDFEEPPAEALFVVDPEPAKEQKKTKSTRSKPKTRCPFDGDRPVLPGEWCDALIEQFPSLDLQHEFKRFVNHHLSKGSVFADWKAAFRNWLTNAVKFQAQNGRFKSGYRPVQNGPTPLAEQDYSTYNDVFGCKIV